MKKTYKKRKWVLALLICFLSFIFLIIFLMIPKNEYEWMLDEPGFNLSYEDLPEDPDAGMRMAIFSTPVIILAILNLTYGFIALQRKGRILLLIYSTILLFLVSTKLLF